MTDETPPVATFGAPGSAAPTAPTAQSAPDEVAPKEPRFVAAIDSSVVQGNRVTAQQAIKPATPLANLSAKVEEAYNNLMNILADVRAAADTLEQTANRLKTGN